MKNKIITMTQNELSFDIAEKIARNIFEGGGKELIFSFTAYGEWFGIIGIGSYFDAPNNYYLADAYGGDDPQVISVSKKDSEDSIYKKVLECIEHILKVNGIRCNKVAFELAADYELNEVEVAKILIQHLDEKPEFLIAGQDVLKIRKISEEFGDLIFTKDKKELHIKVDITEYDIYDKLVEIIERYYGGKEMEFMLKDS